MTKIGTALALVVALSTAAFAQHKHGTTGPNGGPMEDVAGVHAELITSGTALTINVVDENGKPVKAAGYSASALVVTGGQRETVKLEPAGDSALKATLQTPVVANTQVTLMLKTADGKSGQARFKVK
ncbi:hypothetical protein MXD81_03510 [Microbacteriaceae bacterium K1510]|nr:hypothetical protein [Microbacteriaceae bacterium K1510]